MQKQLSMHAQESADEEYEEYLTDEELKDEKSCEAYFLAKRCNIISKDSEKIPIGRNVRRDLAEVLLLKNNESAIRSLSAKILMAIREEAHNGYRNLPPKDQEEILNRRRGTWSFLGNYDIFYSRRKIKYKTNKKGICETLLSLRKELTMSTYRAYKTKELFPRRSRTYKTKKW